MFSTIVVGTDGSRNGSSAVSYASDLAKRETSRLVVVHVDELVPARGGAQHAQVLEPDIASDMQAQIDALKAAGVNAEFHVQQIVFGGPAHAIASVASEVGADLIVVGSRGSGMVAGLLLGSVAHRLLHIAPCPVLVVRGDRSG